VSKTVSELERSGYVRKVPDVDDARARRLEITEHGNELVAATRRARTVVNREVARWLGTARSQRVDPAAARGRRALRGAASGDAATPAGA